jgi:hypothetical protein
MSAIPQISDRWGSGDHVRPGRPADATIVSRWRVTDTAIQWSLQDAVKALAYGTSATAVYIVAGPDSTGPLGLVAIDAAKPYLQLVYLDDGFRGRELGTRAASVVIDQFFAARPTESWLGVTGPIAVAGTRLLRRLGFVELDSGMQLTRSAWRARRAWAAKLF